MDRRAVIALLGSATLLPAGCLSDTPGATGPRNPPNRETRTPTPTAASAGDRTGLHVAEYDFGPADSGDVRVFGTVTNGGTSEATGVVHAGISFGGELLVQETTVTVPAGESRPFELVFDAAYEEFAADGQVFVDIEPEE